jgi:hypothetical protein
MCPACYAGVYKLELYVECRNCLEFTALPEMDSKCASCGEKILIDSYTEDDMWINHKSPNCDSLVWYPWFLSYNSGDGRNKDMSVYLTTVVRIKGEFDADGGFSTSPWYTYQSIPSSFTANIGGEYAVFVYGDEGERLALARFDAVDKSRIMNTDGSTTRIGGVIPVEIIVRFNEDAGKIVIMKDDQEIYSRDVSKHAPEVSFTGLEEDQFIQDQITVTWEASDADGDELYFELWYCVSDSEYYLLASDIKEKSFNADLEGYPGGAGVYFYIYATDGVRTAEARSPVVNAKYTAPQILTEQKDIPKIKVTEEIYFPTKIYDAQDGWLTGS